MNLLLIILVLISNLSFTSNVFARITPDDIYKQNRANFESNLAKIQDAQKKKLILVADQQLKIVNQTVCNKLQLDIDKLSAILEEEKSRQKVTKTVVAYGQGNTQLDTAAYYLNFAAEALAYQRSQDYTPAIGNGNLSQAVLQSTANLKSSLTVLQGKILRAKTEVGKAIN